MVTRVLATPILVEGVRVIRYFIMHERNCCEEIAMYLNIHTEALSTALLIKNYMCDQRSELVIMFQMIQLKGRHLGE